MKTKLSLAVLTLLLAIVCTAQSGVSSTGEPLKGSAKQNDTSGKIAETAVKSDLQAVKSFDVAEGKKGLNAVNVSRSKQSEVRANAKTAVAPESGSTGNIPESKHAINTKGTGATRDK